MSGDGGENLRVGERLYAAGWRQGTVLTAPGVCFCCNEILGPGKDET